MRLWLRRWSRFVRPPFDQGTFCSALGGVFRTEGTLQAGQVCPPLAFDVRKRPFDHGERKMNWLVKTFMSSIGKKQVMAVTGLSFCLFVTVHLMGNLTIYAGKDSFLSYVDRLHSLESLVAVAEFGLIFFAVLHIGMALFLFLANL